MKRLACFGAFLVVGYLSVSIGALQALPTAAKVVSAERTFKDRITIGRAIVATEYRQFSRAVSDNAAPDGEATLVAYGATTNPAGSMSGARFPGGRW